MSTLQERITEALKNAKMKPIDLARRSGVGRATVSLWVNGPTKTLEGDNLTRAANALGVDAHWLATGERKYRSGELRIAEPAALYLADDAGLLLKFKSLSTDDRARISVIIDALLKLERRKS